MKFKNLLGLIKVSVPVSLVVIYALFLTVTFIRYQNDKTRDEELYKKQELERMNFDKTREKKILDMTISDLNLIINLPAFEDYLADLNSKAKITRVQELFSQFSNSRKIYDQIRFLDDVGEERVRVNYTDGQVVVVKDSLLQNKKGRYYFEEALVLGKGAIYISPLDLNVEQNKIEEPYKPMLRIATPVFEGGDKKGILILNYLAKELLDELNSNTLTTGKDLKPELLNKDGYWLNSNLPEREWGFMFEGKKDVTLAKLNPELWEVMQENEEGQVFLKDGLYTYSKIIPVEGFNLEWRVYRFVPNDIVYAGSDRTKFIFIVFDTVVGFFLLILILINNLLINKISKGASLQEKYQYLFNNSHDAIMTLNPPDWKFTDGNPAAIKLFGLRDNNHLRSVTPGDLSPQHQPDGGSSGDEAKKMIETALDKGIHTFNWVHKRIDGEEFFAVVTLNKMRVDGETFLQAVVRDVTDDKKQEELLKKSAEETAKALTESERLNKLMVGRELEMIELKKEIEALKKKS